MYVCLDPFSASERIGSGARLGLKQAGRATGEWSSSLEACPVDQRLVGDAFDGRLYVGQVSMGAGRGVNALVRVLFLWEVT
jgi:hypothetical protein